MRQKALTDAYLRTLRPPTTGRLIVNDTEVTGLALRLSPSKLCIASVRARLPNGDRVRITLGRWPELPLRELRLLAKAKIGDLAKGSNPNVAKAAQRKARAAERRDAERTVAGRLAQWRAAKRDGWSERYATEVERLCRLEVEPQLGNRLLSDVPREDWIARIKEVRKRTKSTATWLYTTLSSFLSHAETSGWITASPMPRRGLNAIAPRGKARERALTDAEIMAVWHASAQFNPKPRAFIRFLLMTATRELEAADLELGEIDVVRARVTLPGSRTKNDRPHSVPLHPLLLTELQRIWPDPPNSPEHRLFGARGGSGFRGFSGLKRRLDVASGVTGWVWHDLRRTARSSMSRLAVPPQHAEAALNHISSRSQLERIYDRHDFTEEAVAALQVWQEHVAALIAGENTGVRVA